MLLNRLYYQLKPVLPASLRIGLRRIWAKRKRRYVQDIWPINPVAAKVPEGWPGWPEGKRFALILTHDVEGRSGLERCRRLMELESSLGFRSSFNFIPEGAYSVPKELRDALTKDGFELGVHDLRHDGKLFWSRESFRSRAAIINKYLAEWGAVGFRSGFMMRKLDWLHDLNSTYDASTFDTDPFEPEPDGVNTIFPFWVPGPEGQPGTGNSEASRGRGYVELPYTLVQDSTLFFVLGESTEIWKQKLEWIAARGGMALLITHPDYMNFGGGRNGTNTRSYPAACYEEFLKHVKARYGNEYWHGLPREVAGFFERAYATVRKPLRRKRVCMVTYSFYESDNRVMRYAGALAERGDLVDVIALNREGKYPKDELLGHVRVHRVQARVCNEKGKLSYLSRIARFLVTASLHLAKRHLRERYDVVHVHNVPDFLVFAAWLPKVTGSGVILDIHDILPEFYASKFSREKSGFLVGFLKYLERVSARFAHHVIISNHLWFEIITSRSVPKEKCSVFINYVDTKLFQWRNGTPKADRRLVIYPGGLHWHQGLDLAIQAFARVSKEVPSAEFHIYGEGPVKGELVSLTRTLGLDQKVRFFGTRPITEIVDIVAKADVGVVAKRANSFGDQAYRPR
jgi:glycosyltransferase involved in cell wall biosynthesis